MNDDPQLPPPEPVIPLPPGSMPPPLGVNKDDRFYYYWDRFQSKPKYPKISIIPSLDVDEEGQPSHRPGANAEGVLTSQNATTSYEEARAACEKKVEAISNECRRLNTKYLDRMFELPNVDTLSVLNATEMPYSLKGLAGVGSVKRIEDIFEKPQFFEDGASANDICQGTVGDCWFLSAVAALSGKPELLERICVKRDEKIGVYGFVFYRDGEWISEVVDDRLCLSRKDDQFQYPTEYLLKVNGDKNLDKIDIKGGDEHWIQKLPKKFREELRKGSDALYFSSCRSKNETWLPLLEKAYAKAHGDYQSIEGGFPGEGIEDLTGGVATYLFSEDVLDKDKLWEELKQVNKDFLFGCGSRYGRDSDPQDDEGFVRGHAYTVIEARDVKGYKPPPSAKRAEKAEVQDLQLLKIRNPWGSTEWNGAWSDGSKEWTAAMMQDLNHTFGDDGVFWISYQDFLKYYPEIDRTRLFGNDWTVTQQWTSVEVPWTTDYLKTKFTFSLKKASPVVLVLSQPDDRFFQGLIGRYTYTLFFRLYKDGERTYLLRSMEDSGSGRSVSAELDLEAGDYTVYVKIKASRNNFALTPQDAIKLNKEFRRAKLESVGRSFDLTHSKGKLREAEQAKDKRDKTEEKTMSRKGNVLERNKKRRERAKGRKKAERKAKEEERRKDEKLAEKKKKRAAEKAEKAKKAATETNSPEEEDKKEEENEPSSEPSKSDKVKSKDSKADVVSAADEKAVVKGDASHVDAPQEKAEETQQPRADKTDPEVKPEEDVSKKPAITGSETTVISTPAGSSTHRRAPSRGPPAAVTNSSTAEQTSDSKVNVPTDTSTAEPTPKSSNDASEPKPESKSSQEPPQSPKTTKSTSQSATITVTAKIDTPTASSDESDVSDVSDVDSVQDDDFEWDSDIDGSVATESEEEELEGDDLYKDAPWNAICVVGLKVCHKGVHGEVEIGVEH